MFEEEKKKLKRLLLQVKHRTSPKKLARLAVQFERTKGESTLPLTCNCHAHTPMRVSPKSSTPFERSEVSSPFRVTSTIWSTSRFTQSSPEVGLTNVSGLINHPPQARPRNE